jgi:outer membrane protein OmpA-like peptidoglycan-associated protein
MRKTTRIGLAFATATLLSACVTTPPPAQGGARSPGAAPASSGSFFGNLFGSGLSPALEAQRDRLKQALSGTPVVIDTTDDHRLRVNVPTRHAFDPGRAAIKPALGAVLEQVAIGFKPYAATTELRIAAPGDDKAPARLVQDRAAAVRDELIARGVPASRIAEPGPASPAGLELLLSDRPLNK